VGAGRLSSSVLTQLGTGARHRGGGALAGVFPGADARRGEGIAHEAQLPDEEQQSEWQAKSTSGGQRSLR
jgi:hypothetical protein